MKKTKTILLGMALMCTSSLYAANINLIINNEVVNEGVMPISQNGTVLVPLRVITERLGANVKWEPKKGTITIKSDYDNIVLTIGSKIAKVNGEIKYLEVAPRTIKGTTMVPIRFIAENFHTDSEVETARVKWDSSTQSVLVNSDASATAKLQDISEQEICMLLQNASKQVLTVMNAYDFEHPGNMEGYCRLKASVNTPAKMKSYLTKYCTQQYYEDFVDTLGDALQLKNGEYYLLLGDVGMSPDFSQAVITQISESENEKEIVLSAPFEDGESWGKYTAVIKREGGIWKVDYLN